MAERTPPPNLVKAYRRQRGWSQAELARRAGISRAAVSAIEINRLVPSVAAGLALAAALGCTVEALFGRAAGEPTEPAWAWPPPASPCRYWQAQVGGRVLRYPAEATPAGLFHDGIFQNHAFVPRSDADPAATLVLACCDPAAGLLASAYARSCGFRLLVLTRSSREALALLGRGLVHAAGVHFATEQQPDGNVRTVHATLGPAFRLLRVARWQEGLSVSPGVGIRTIAAAVRSRLRWVGREPGSAARQCLDELLCDRRPPQRVARDHRGVAEAVRCGWADVGVCHRLVCEEAGLRFLGVRQEHFDVCYPAAAETDPRLAALLRVVRSSSYRQLLGELPGYDTTQTGEVHDAG
jgi:molybdate-binding protein/transcriptional regulator with XRE-family HTH domain